MATEIESVCVKYNTGLLATKSNLFASIDMQMRYITDPSSVIRTIFPYAFVVGPAILFDGFTVSTAMHFDHNYGGWMAPGQWACAIQRQPDCLPDKLSGFDLLGLVATHCRGMIKQDENTFPPTESPTLLRRAFEILAEVFGLTCFDTPQQCHFLKGWQQVRSPYFVADDIAQRIKPQIPGIFREYKTYINVSGNICSFVFYYIVETNERIPVYVTLMHHKSSGRYQWLPIFPEKPFMLYNGDRIFSDVYKKIVFCNDEKEADNFCNPQCIGTTVPGGIANFLDADLHMLRGRKILMTLTTDDLKLGRLFRDKLHRAGVLDSEFSLYPLGEPPHQGQEVYSFNDLESVATARKVGLHVSTTGDKAVIQPVISRPGEAIPGSDVNLRTILDPIIHEGDLVWLYADSKAGKTWMALALAHAVAVRGGALGKWHSPEKWDVLYVDGEMKPSTLQQRINKILVGQGLPPGEKPFSVLSAKTVRDGFIDIGAEEWQQAIEHELTGIHLLILDNFQSLTDNAVNTMMQIRSWLHRVTSNKVAVMVIDHTNRQGDLQGSLAKVRNADLTISMSVIENLENSPSAEDANEKETARILVEFPDGARELHGDQIAPFVLDRRFSDGGVTFVLSDEKGVSYEKFIKNKRRVILRRMAAVCVLRGKKPQESFDGIASHLGWSQGIVHADEKRAARLAGFEKRFFEVCLGELTGKERGGIPPEKWGIEPSSRRLVRVG